MHVQRIKPFSKTIEVDPDKSITHRALILGAAARGTTRILCPSTALDCLSTAGCLKNCGVRLSITGSEARVEGGIKSGEFFLDAGNSGTTLRLLTGLLASKSGITAHFSGDESLQKRPMTRVIEPLKQMGARIEGGFPVKIFGSKLQGMDYFLSVPSAQVKSAILLAGLEAEGTTTLSGELDTRNHTELMLKCMGADISVFEDKIAISPSALNAIDLQIAGDFSSAIYFIALALLCKGSAITIKNVNVNPTRTAAMELLKNLGGKIFQSNQRNQVEKSADITAEYSTLAPFYITKSSASQMIDELPLLAVVACFIEGESTIEGASELRYKESDRLSAIFDGLTKMGADIKIKEDGLVIVGHGTLKGGCTVSSCSDHRIEMSLAIAAALSEQGASVQSGHAAISFPSFYRLLSEVTK